MPSQRTVYELNAPSPALVDAALAGSRREVFWLQDSAPAPRFDPLVGAAAADLTVVGGGYAGLWTAVRAKRRNPAARVVLLEGQQIGWAASGRNGGFCEASLTHGAVNGRNRWPDEFDELGRLGLANLDGFAADVAELGLDCQFERSGMLTVAVETHQLDWAKAGPGYLTQDQVRGGDRQPAVPGRELGPRRRPGAPGSARPRAGPGGRRAGRPDPRALPGHRDRQRPLRPGRGAHRARQRAVGHGRAGHERLPRAAAPGPAVHRADLRLRPDDRAALRGAAGRGRLAEPAGPVRHGQPVPLHPAHRRQPHPVRRLRRDLPLRPAGQGVLRGPPGQLPAAGRTLLRDVPAAGRGAVQPPLGRRRRRVHAVLRVLRPGPAGPGGLHGRLHRPGGRSHAVRRRRHAGPARRRADRTHRARAWCAASPSRSRRSRWRRPESSSPAGHSTARTTGKAAATP